jgi:hypothetical protein
VKITERSEVTEADSKDIQLSQNLNLLKQSSTRLENLVI